MANLHAAIRGILTADADVVALVDDRIRPGELDPTDTLPACLVLIQEDAAQDDLLGSGGWGQAVVRVECLDTDQPRAEQLAAAVREALDDYRGTVAGVTITPATYTGMERETEPATDDGEAAWHIVAPGFSVWYHS